MDGMTAEEEKVKQDVEVIVRRLRGVARRFKLRHTFSQAELEHIAHEVMTLPDSLQEAMGQYELPW